MPDPIKAMEMMNQLNLDYGGDMPAVNRRPYNNDEETARKFQQKMEDAITEREAQKNLRKIETNKAKFDVGQMADQARAERAAANEYTKSFSGNTRGGGGGGSGGMGTGKMNRDISKLMKKGGKVSSASKRADGCCIKGKTKGRMV